MDIKKLAPWNWFKDEETSEGRELPVTRAAQPLFGQLGQLHQEIDRIFDTMLRGFDVPSLIGGAHGTAAQDMLFKPSVDVAATNKEYTVTVELPGVEEKDVKLELVNDTLVIRGEKKRELEQKDKNFHRVECSYGSFQRVLSLPEDADRDNINAAFRNGIVTVTLPRRAVKAAERKTIEVRHAA